MRRIYPSVFGFRGSGKVLGSLLPLIGPLRPFCIGDLRKSAKGSSSKSSSALTSLDGLEPQIPLKKPSIAVEASRFIRKMRGGAQAHLIEAVDGSSYVVKFTNNPQHARILINEWLASTVLRYLRVSTPDTAIVNISADFIHENPELHIQLASRRAPAAPGQHFGSRFAGGGKAVYDQLPRTLLGSVANLLDFRGTLVADKWLGNTDSRQSVFVRVPSVNRKLAFSVQMIDNGHAFDGGCWSFGDASACPPSVDGVYESVRGLDDFEPWLTLVATFPEAILQAAFLQTPVSWRAGDTGAAFEILLDQLMRRRQRVSDLICACRAQPANPFPKWL